METRWRIVRLSICLVFTLVMMGAGVYSRLALPPFEKERRVPTMVLLEASDWLFFLEDVDISQPRHPGGVINPLQEIHHDILRADLERRGISLEACYAPEGKTDWPRR